MKLCVRLPCKTIVDKTIPITGTPKKPMEVDTTGNRLVTVIEAKYPKAHANIALYNNELIKAVFQITEGCGSIINANISVMKLPRRSCHGNNSKG